MLCNKLFVKYFSLSLLIVALDQLSKYYAVTLLNYAEPVVVLPFFNITLHYNSGVAFGLFSGSDAWRPWLLAAIALAVMALLVYWLWQIKKNQWVLGLGLAFILGGAIANLCDRLRLAYVVDFIVLHYQSWYFPTFNLADAAITLGALLFIIDSIWHPYDDNRSEKRQK